MFESGGNYTPIRQCLSPNPFLWQTEQNAFYIYMSHSMILLYDEGRENEKEKHPRIKII